VRENQNQNETQRKQAMREEQIKAEITGTKNDRTVFSKMRLIIAYAKVAQFIKNNKNDNIHVMARVNPYAKWLSSLLYHYNLPLLPRVLKNAEKEPGD